MADNGALTPELVRIGSSKGLDSSARVFPLLLKESPPLLLPGKAKTGTTPKPRNGRRMNKPEFSVKGLFFGYYHDSANRDFYGVFGQFRRLRRRARGLDKGTAQPSSGR